MLSVSHLRDSQFVYCFATNFSESASTRKTSLTTLPIRCSVGGIGRVHVHVFLRWDPLDEGDEALLVCHAGSSCCDPSKIRVCGLVGQEGVAFEAEATVRLFLLHTLRRRLIRNILSET